MTKKGRVDDLSSSGVGQVQLLADTTPGAEYQLDSVAEVRHDPGEGAADPIFVGVHINDQELLMELDTCYVSPTSSNYKYYSDTSHGKNLAFHAHAQYQ